MDIEVGQRVAWDSTLPCLLVGRVGEGIVVAKSGDNLSILNEKLAKQSPYMNPFASFKTYQVYPI